MMYLGADIIRQLFVATIFIVICSATNGSDKDVSFTHPSYNVSIFENSRPRTYVAGSRLMGISLLNLPPAAHVRFTIVEGDPSEFFAAEAIEMGGFAVLRVRTKTGMHDVLNRERKDFYSLKVAGDVRSYHRAVIAPMYSTVNVKIRDVNDNIPLFYEMSYVTSINEDAAMHSSVLRVVADDADVGMNGEVYYFLADPTIDMFAVHPTSGIVTLTSELKYADRNVHRLKIYAKDRGIKSGTGGISSYSHTQVSVSLKRVNLNSPIIRVTHLPHVIEHAHTNIYAIIKVSDTDAGENGLIEKVEITEGDDSQLFSVSRGSKVNEFNLSVLKLLDRELAPDGYNLTVKAYDKGTPQRSSVVHVRVSIADVNDHSPVFAKELYEETISEETPPHTPVVKVAAFDSDQHNNGKVLFRILVGNDDDKFHINSHTGIISTTDWIDAEENAYFTFRIAAIDQAGSTQRKQSSAKVVIKVKDANDNTPHFSTPNTEVTIDENEPAGSYVTRVMATDADSGENGFVSYSIANLDEVPFDIDPFDGTIRTSSILDYESQRRVYTIKVRASDWGQPFKRETETTVKVNVKDVNDNRPVFVGTICAGWIDVDSPMGSSIMTFKAVDLDAGDKVFYRIENADFKNCWSLDRVTGILAISCRLKDKLRKLTKESIEVSVIATDETHVSDMATVTLALVDKGKYSSRRNNAQVTCQESNILVQQAEIESSVTNNNDASQSFALFPPRYGFNSYSPEFSPTFPEVIDLSEDASVGRTVIHVNATDRDKGMSGRIVYTISDGNEDSVFKIDMYAGTILLWSALDRERTGKYSFNITVYDLGTPQRSASRRLTVRVTDVNDNAPEFERASYNLFIPENTRNGTSIAQVSATDPDEGANGEVTYELVTSTEEFYLHPRTGSLYIHGPLDRERVSQYDLRVRAWDGSKVYRRYSLARVLIDIIDVNDCAPDFGAGGNLRVNIPEDYPTGAIIATVKAVDEDSEERGKVIYAMVSGHENHFRIDSRTGIVRVADELDFEKKQVYNITISAEDKGHPALSSMATLMVQIVDITENFEPPRIADKLVKATVLENEPAGTLVYAVKAIDPDGYSLSYNIVGGTGIGMFSISASGEIRTLRKLNREVQKGYWLTVRVTDDAVSQLSDTCHVYVEVIDVCDKVPQTEFPVYRPSIPEDAPVGTTVLTLRAFDDDLSPSNISFSIVKGRRRRANWFLNDQKEQDAEEVFQIDARTGVITTIGRLDRERQSDYDIWVAVSDGTLTSHTPIFVTIGDVNDNAPSFMEKVYRFNVPTRRKKKKEPIFRVFAYDPDDARNSNIRYSLKNHQKKSRFKINPLNGQIYAPKSLPAGQSFDLKVKAVDSGQPQLTGTAHIIVKVVGLPVKSLHRPKVDQPTNSHVMVSDVPGHVVTFINAEDLDEDPLWYSIIDGDPGHVFSIGFDSGLVSLAKPLSHKGKSKYLLTISVTDGTSKTAVKLAIQVMDYSRYRPIFTQRTYRVSISESAEVGMKLTAVECRNQENSNAIPSSSLYYSIQYTEGLESENVFDLDSTTGFVTVSAPLDRETAANHVLTVSCRDRGALQREDFARVIVTVEDANDHDPMFLDLMIQSQVSEGAAVGSLVTTVTAIDSDKGENGKLTYAIVEGNEGGAFSIDSELGAIYLSQSLLNKHTTEFLLLVRAMDNAQQPRSASIPVRISVDFSHDAAPVWSQDKRSKVIELSEWTPRDYVVADLTALSPSPVQYSIIGGNEQDNFRISKSSGILILKNSLDYKNKDFYNLTIRVENSIRKHKDTWLAVRVLDENDWRPQWVKMVFDGDVAVSVSAGEPVFAVPVSHNPKPLIVSAVDRDSGRNGRVSYSMVDIDAKRYFMVDEFTGVIRVKNNLEDLSGRTVTFDIWAVDGGFPARDCVMPAEVRVSISEKPKSPTLFSSDTFMNTLYLPLLPNMRVTCVSPDATDDSAGVSSTYSIVEGNTHNIFTINHLTGCVDVQSHVSGEAFYNLTVFAKNGEAEANATVGVNALSLPETSLHFGRDKYWINILENSRSEMNLLVVAVRGLPLNQHVNYSILNPSQHFQIRPTSGVFKTTGVPIDREKQDHFVFIIEAREINRPERFGRVMIHVSVMDVNDNEPVFVGRPYNALVSTGAKRGHVITKVKAVDPDSGSFGQIRYELVRGNGELFNVDQIKGEIQLKQSIPQADKTYSLTVAAFDGGKQPLSSHVHVIIRVVSADGPMFNEALYVATIPEDRPSGTPVVRVHAASPSEGDIIYSIIIGNEKHLFELEYNTGKTDVRRQCLIRTSSKLDYEIKSEHNLTIRARDPSTGLYSDGHVTVIVSDINDNPPTFSDRIFVANVSEAAYVGAIVTKVKATDVDTGVAGSIRYSCTKGCGNFTINPESGIVRVAGKLDAEYERQHLLTITAHDGGYPSLNSTTVVKIILNDFNDNVPVWTQDSYEGRISIDASPGHMIISLLATDPDVSSHGRQLRYNIHSGDPQRLFEIDQAYGLLSVTAPHRLTGEMVYKLNVSVWDGVHVAFTMVRVTVLSANNSPPRFDRPLYVGEIEENSPPGEFIVRVNATDNDEGKYGHLRFRILGQEKERFFRIDHEGNIRTERSLDREVKSLHNIIVSAQDEGGKIAFASVRVIVRDRNDNEPTFGLSEYQANIAVNTPSGATILKVSATDIDESVNSDIRYSIYESDNSKVAEIFQVNSQTGEIFLKSDVTGLENEVYQFFIRARDSGSPELHSDTAITIFLMALHENAPHCPRKYAQYFHPEDSPIGTIVTSLWTSSSIRYRLYNVGGDEEDGRTFVLSDNGDLIINSALDSESRRGHQLIVANQTLSTPPLVDYMAISVVVMDVNDCTPQFSSSQYEIEIAENTARGSTLFVLTATDEDQGSNGQIQYTLSDGNDELIGSLVSVDPHLGSVVLMREIDREEVAEISFTVVASDSGAKPLRSTANVRIAVLDYNDNPPIFAKEHYVTNVPEDTSKGTVILELFFTDRDETAEQVEFFVTAGDSVGNFLINANGQVYIARPLDRENTDKYYLMVTATDGKFSANTTVDVFVLDVNDNGPECKSIESDLSLPEDAKVGTYLVDVISWDADEASNAKSRFSISGEGVEDFRIDKHSGQISTARQLDREEKAQYRLIVTVEDWEHAEWNCSVDVKIDITDVNDNSPRFLKTSYSVFVPEDSAVNSVIAKVSAVDPDSDLGSLVYYFIQDSPDAESFWIDENEGIIFLKRSLDRETVDSYKLTVEAVDGGTPMLSSSVIVSVTVMDINDNAPEFVRTIVQVTLPENQPVGTEISLVMATSKDIGVNAEITYSIEHTSPKEHLRIHPKTGVISIEAIIDYEEVQLIVANVVATDSGVPPLFTTALVNVTVTDVNDNTPTFTRTSYRAAVPENEKLGRSILQVSANDMDDGENGKIMYSIVGGNKNRHFSIESQSGVIFLSKSLDREMVSSYDLRVQAEDKGIPANKDSVLVVITIEDVNDNPPTFAKDAYTAVVQENRPYGYAITRLMAEDEDLDPNGPPFSWELIEEYSTKNSLSKFTIDNDGTLKLATHRLDHRAQSNYRVKVRVWDNGLPQLSAETFIDIMAVAESMYPPTVFPLQANVVSYLEPFSGGIIGKVSAMDQDPYDTLQYTIVPESLNEANYFDIDQQDGTLVAISPLDSGTYPISVNITDGKYSRVAKASVNVFIIEEEMVKNSVVVRIDSITPDDFISQHQRLFVSRLAKVLRSRPKNILLLSIQHASLTRNNFSKRDVHGATDILLSVTNGTAGSFMARDGLMRKLASLSGKNYGMRNLDISVIPSTCSRNDTCSGHGSCIDVIELSSEDISSFNTQLLSLSTPKFMQIPGCECIQGYDGVRCNNLVNACGHRPCFDFEECFPSDDLARGYTCHCPSGKAGPRCQVDLSLCKEPSCHYPVRPLSFKGKGYAHYLMKDPLDTNKFQFSTYVRTRYPSGVILCAEGDVDYSILEIVGGHVQYRWECGSGEGLVKFSDTKVDDDSWHLINLTRDGTQAVLWVDNKFTSGSAPGVHDILNVPSDAVFIGGKVQRIGKSSLQVQLGFVGCIDLMTMNYAALPISTKSPKGRSSLKRLANADLRCPIALELPGICGSHPCTNGGKCFESDGTFNCSCPPRYVGKQCQIDTTPCASQPCLNEGQCTVVQHNYKCQCPTKFSGSRCEYGMYCNPNPCQNGGRCEEGTSGPICKCHRFTGTTCEMDVDECILNPCQNGGTCLNLYGNFRCLCHSNVTGQYCSEIVPSTGFLLSVKEILCLLFIIAAVLVITFCLVVWKRRTLKQKRHQQNNRVKLTGHHVKNDLKCNDSIKRNSKICNVEADQLLLPRPPSFAPAGTTDPYLLNHLKKTPEHEAFELNTLNGRIPVEYNLSKQNLHCSLPSPKAKESNRKPWDHHNNLNEAKPSLNKEIGFDLPPNLEESPKDSSTLNSSYSDNSSVSVTLQLKPKGLHWDDYDLRSSSPMLTFGQPPENMNLNLSNAIPSEQEDQPLLQGLAVQSPQTNRSNFNGIKAEPYSPSKELNTIPPFSGTQEDNNISSQDHATNFYSVTDLPPPAFEPSPTDEKISNLSNGFLPRAKDATGGENELANKLGSPRCRRPFHRKDYGRASDVSFLSALEEEQNGGLNIDEENSNLVRNGFSKSEDSVYEVHL